MRILGVEFGGWSLKAVEMESRFRRLEVLELHEVRLPLQNLDPAAAYKAAYEQLIARLPIHPEKIVTSIPPAQTAFRFLQIPLKQRKKVEQNFRFELEDAVPFKLDEAIVEHHVTTLKEGSLVFAAIAPKKHVQIYLDWLKGIGLDPDWLTFEGMGIINLFLNSQTRESNKREPDQEARGPIAILDIGHVKTTFAVVDDGRLCLIRSIPWGGLAVTQAISTGLIVSIEEAEQKKLRDLRLDEETPKNSELEELLSSSIQSFSTLVTDISHSIGTYRGQFKKEIKSFVLTGGTSKTRGIDDFLKRAFGVPVTFFRPFKDTNVTKEVDPALEMRFGEALGRASVFGRQSELLFNFRQDDLAKTTSLNEIGVFLKDPNIIKLAKYFAILAVILFVGVIGLGYIAQEESRKSREDVRKVFNETFKGINAKLQTKIISSPAELKKYIDGKNNEVTQKLKLMSKSKGSMIALIRTVSDCFPGDIRVDVNTLTFDDRSLKVEGVLYQGDLHRVLETMKKVPNFDNVTLSTEGQRFTFKGNIATGKQ